MSLLWQGYRTLLSSPWYLNLGEMASEDWVTYYGVDPLGFPGSREQHQLVMGGEVSLHAAAYHLCLIGTYIAIVISRSRNTDFAMSCASDATVERFCYF